MAYLSGALRVSTANDSGAGGARSHVLGLIGGLEQIGWRVHRYIAGDELAKQSIQTTSPIAKRMPMWAVDTARLALRFSLRRKALHSVPADVQFVYERFASFQALGLAFQRRGVPWVLETNGPFFYEAAIERDFMAYKRLARRMEIAAYRSADAVVCVSNALRRIVTEIAQVPESKCLTIPNGVDTDRFDPQVVDQLRLSDHFTVGYVGALIPWQGLNHMLYALSQVRKDGLNVHLVVVGDGSAKADLTALVQHLHLQSAVTFTGQVPWQDVPRYIAGFDVCFSGQQMMQIGAMYHSPLKLYEYLAMGKPVIASSFEDATRLIDEGINGFLFNPADEESLTRAIIAAHAVIGTRAPFNASIRDHIVSHHSWLARTEELLSGLQALGVV